MLGTRLLPAETISWGPTETLSELTANFETPPMLVWRPEDVENQRPEDVLLTPAKDSDGWVWEPAATRTELLAISRLPITLLEAVSEPARVSPFDAWVATSTPPMEVRIVDPDL